MDIYEVFPKVLNFRNGSYRWVTRDSDLVIEGAPRSANTFLHRIVRAGSHYDLKIAQHVHRPLQLRLARRFEIPTYFLIREPKEALASILIFSEDGSVARRIQRYIDLYEAAARLSEEYGRFWVLDFDDVTTRPDVVANRMFRDIGSSYEVDAELIASATEDSESDATKSSLPNAEKAVKKAMHYSALLGHPLFEKANRSYEFLRKRRLVDFGVSV